MDSNSLRSLLLITVKFKRTTHGVARALQSVVVPATTKEAMAAMAAMAAISSKISNPIDQISN